MNKLISISIFICLVFVLIFSGSHFACSSGDPPQTPFPSGDAQIKKDTRKTDQKSQPKKDDGVEVDQAIKDQFIDVVPSDAYVDVLASDGA